jgi:hypothetical protein
VHNIHPSVRRLNDDGAGKGRDARHETKHSSRGAPPRAAPAAEASSCRFVGCSCRKHRLLRQSAKFRKRLRKLHCNPDILCQHTSCCAHPALGIAYRRMLEGCLGLDCTYGAC